MITRVSSSVIIYNNKNEVLISRRSDAEDYYPGYWETIGGSLEYGESPLECIQREVMEEIGCELHDIRLLDVYSFVSKESGMQAITVQYTGKIKTKPIPKTDEITELKWISKNDVNNYTFAINCKERVMDYFKSFKDR